MDEEMDNGGEQKSWIARHPTVIIGAVIFMVVVVGGFLINKNKGQSSQTSTPQQPVGDLSGLQTDSQGNPIVYRDVSDVFYNYSQVEGSYNSSLTSNSNNTTTTSSTTSVTNNPPPPSPPTQNTSTSTPQPTATSNSYSWQYSGNSWQEYQNGRDTSVSVYDPTQSFHVDANGNLINNSGTIEGTFSAVTFGS